MKKVGKIILAIVIAVIIAVVSALVYTLTNGFTSDVKNFMLIRDGEYILADTQGVSIHGGETFEVYHYDEDDDISVKIIPLEIENDFMFTLSGYDYSWNSDVVRYSEDFTNFFTVEIDQDKNTVNISGRLQTILQKYAETLNGTLESMQGLPASDMFRLSVTTDKSTLSLDFRILANVESISLSEGELSFS